MMVYRCHFKNSLSMRHLEIGNLQNDRKHFHKINKGENRNIQGKFRLQRHRHHETAERKRTRISHKNLCGISIEYEKSQNSAEHRAGQGSEGVSSQKKLIGKEEKKYNHRGNTSAKSVNAIRKVRAGIRRRNDKEGNREKPDSEKQLLPLYKGEKKSRAMTAEKIQVRYIKREITTCAAIFCFGLKPSDWCFTTFR